jgi:hypothetical protein
VSSAIKATRHSSASENNKIITLFMAKSEKMSVQNIIFEQLSSILINFLRCGCDVARASQQHVFYLLSWHDASRYASCFDIEGDAERWNFG